MSIRDRIQKLELRGPAIDRLAEEQRGEQVQAFLQSLSDADLDALERFMIQADADPDSREANVCASIFSYPELMDEVRRVAA